MKTAKTMNRTDETGCSAVPVLDSTQSAVPVIPAKAGIQACQEPMHARRPLDPRFRGDDGTRSRYGFTLLEVLVALTILAVGILGVMRLFPMALVQQRRAAERTVIASLARTQLSEVRTGGVGTALNSWIQNNAFHVLDQAARGYTLYESWRSSVTRMGQSDVDLYRVVFTVRMNDGREEEFVTYVTER